MINGNSVQDSADPSIPHLPTPPVMTPQENRATTSSIFNSTELQCTSIQSSISANPDLLQLQSNEMQKLQDMMTVLRDNEDDVIPVEHVASEDSSMNISSAGTSSKSHEEVYSSPENELQLPSQEERINTESQENEDETNETKDAARKNSVHLTKDLLLKDSEEPYKINIPLKKRVNQSTKKKLWREIERRKPFITQNVATHIQKYAKPPFITWGCKTCEFPYEIQSYSKEYWHD